jgi:hypothetical protein
LIGYGRPEGRPLHLVFIALGGPQAHDCFVEKTFPGMVRGTADRSAALPMNKALSPQAFNTGKRKTAGPSTSLRFGRDDNLFVTLTFRTIDRCGVHLTRNLPQASQGALNEQGCRAPQPASDIQSRRDDLKVAQDVSPGSEIGRQAWTLEVKAALRFRAKVQTTAPPDVRNNPIQAKRGLE